MSQYKLTYFNIRGRAELIRLIFAQASVQYEDKRIAKEEWVELKPKTPNGSLPTLEVDGKTLPGSIPIARLVAERFGVAGSNDIENTEIAGVMDCLTDLVTSFMKVMFEKDETRKAELKKNLTKKNVQNICLSWRSASLQKVGSTATDRKSRMLTSLSSISLKTFQWRYLPNTRG